MGTDTWDGPGRPGTAPSTRPAMGAAAQRRQKRKKQKGTGGGGARTATIAVEAQLTDTTGRLDLRSRTASHAALPEDVAVEYVAADFAHSQLPPEFASVFERFQLPEDAPVPEPAAAQPAWDQEDMPAPAPAPAPAHAQTSTPTPIHTPSKKKLKKMLQLSLAALKEYARRPELVEWEDVTARDARLLVQLKAARNSVPVPKHWSRKRKYLAGKRGFVKPPFQLPAFIQATGITELRDSMRSEDAGKSSKVRAREKMHPRLGRMAIDYERLYDAFFLHQTKPRLTPHGDLYWEGREFEGRGGRGADQRRPGFLSEDLRAALGLSNALHPPPWIFNMQRHGPPPAYPFLRIAGVNAPIPPGAQWGFHPGGWGRPPLTDAAWAAPDGAAPSRGPAPIVPQLLVPIDRTAWGEFEPDDVDADEDEDEAADTAGAEHVHAHVE